MKRDDAGPMIPRAWALHALVVSLSYQVRDELHGFVRGDLCIRERVTEDLLDIGHGTLRKREQLGKLTLTVHRDASGRRWFSLLEIANEMIDGRIARNMGKDVK
ncbi:hypothetical protein NOV72_03285 [Caballeronia novacaledonica]|uniref:Uncharacterized protein n=1 Tax=Caballeronia novacaledonica TaxID=1544861 RepID=A0A2U3I7C1_9BURK|nr:hypothetical protein [Caballeronia novacaledonica]SPB16085.1 hypothetical protein NOV72_03285 [Caballeronia novacaledonica]